MDESSYSTRSAQIRCVEFIANRRWVFLQCVGSNALLRRCSKDLKHPHFPALPPRTPLMWFAFFGPPFVVWYIDRE